MKWDPRLIKERAEIEAEKQRIKDERRMKKENERRAVEEEKQKHQDAKDAIIKAEQDKIDALNKEKKNK